MAPAAGVTRTGLGIRSGHPAAGGLKLYGEQSVVGVRDKVY